MTENQEQKGFTLGKGCLIFILVAIGVFIYFWKFDSGDSSSSKVTDPNPCLASEYFIKQDLNYPNEAKLPFLDCNVVDENFKTYTILRKITAKNAFGIESDYIYKVKMTLVGDDPLDDSSWMLESIKSEKVK